MSRKTLDSSTREISAQVAWFVDRWAASSAEDER